MPIVYVSAIIHRKYAHLGRFGGGGRLRKIVKISALWWVLRSNYGEEQATFSLLKNC